MALCIQFIKYYIECKFLKFPKKIFLNYKKITKIRYSVKNIMINFLIKMPIKKSINWI